MRDPAFEEWIEEARALPIARALDLVAPHHAIFKKSRYIGPCPGCGGVDRFSLNLKKNIFWCRKSAEGGDAIALARHVRSAEFLEAVELLTGRPAPGRTISEEERQARAARVAELEARRKAEAERAAAEQNDFRSREIERARRIWRDAGPLKGSIAEAYLRHRDVEPGPGAKLRAVTDLPYWHNIDGAWRAIYSGPALVAAIQGTDQRFIGCHITWIDRTFSTASGKAQIVHPETGELLDAKKVRGSQKGGHIHLGGEGHERRLVVGEGIETVLSVRCAECLEGRLAPSLYWSSVNLHNLGGKSAGSVPHPSLTITDVKGRVRPQRVPGPQPDPSDTAVMAPPEHVTEILLLGDGDSEHFTTRNVLLRFAARWRRPGRAIRAAWAEQGADFNDMLRGAAA
ncbi:MAG: DNA primase [Armatimonadia bacterium]